MLKKKFRPNRTRKWSALKANVGGFTVVGVDLPATISNLSVDINIKDTASNSVINFVKTPVSTVIGGKTISFDMAGETKRVSADLSLNIADFFSVSGRFGLDMVSGQQISVLNTTTNTLGTATANMIAISAVNVNAFVGMNEGSSNEIGLKLTGVNFAYASYTDVNNTANKWTVLKASAVSAGFVGTGSDLTISTSNVSVEINSKAANSTVIDFTIPVTTAAGVILNMKGETLKASGNVDLNLYGFVTVSGGFALEKTTSKSVTLSNTKSVQVNMLTLGLSHVNAFIGYGQNTPDAMGLNITDLNLALVIASEKVGTRSWVAAQASIGSATLLTNIQDFNASISSAFLAINRKASDGTTIDFSGTKALNVTIAPATTVALNMKGETLQVSGTINLNLFNYITVNGDFAFEKAIQSVTVVSSSGGKTNTSANVLAFGMANVNAFAGFNQGKTDELGFKFINTSVAFALISDGARQWTSLKASATQIAFVGIPDVTASATNMNIAVNMAASDGSSLDYSINNLKIGGSNSVVLDLAPNTLQVSGNVKLNLFNMVVFEGDFGFTKKTGQVVTLSDGTTPTVDIMEMTAFSVNAFAGFSSANTKIGFDLSNVNLALVFMVDQKNAAHKWTSLSASVGSAGFVGSDQFFVGGTGLNLNLNMGYNDASGNAVVANRPRWSFRSRNR